MPSLNRPTQLSRAAIETHEHLVLDVVRAFRRRLPATVATDDLYAAGVAGLLDAMRKHQPDHDASFDNYARIRVRGAIVDALRVNDWLPRRARLASKRVDDASSPPSQVVSIVSLEDISLSERLSALTDPRSSPERQVAASRLRVRLLAAVDELPERQRLIVTMHYFEGLRFKRIGFILGVSEARISQLHARSMELIRAVLDDEPASGIRIRAAEPVAATVPPVATIAPAPRKRANAR